MVSRRNKVPHEYEPVLQEQLATIPINRLKPAKVLLRPVNKRSLAYLEMKTTIRNRGLFNSISVRPTNTPDLFEIIDGSYRVECCKELNWEAMPCIIKHGMSDVDVLASQIMANSIRPETKPVEFAKQLKRIQVAIPDITLSEIGGMVGKGVHWIKEQLNLLDLIPIAQEIVDSDGMPLCNAYMLAKIPTAMQPQYLLDAQEMTVTEFKAVAVSVIRHVMEDIKTGKLENWFVKEFKPLSYLRPLKEVLKELESAQVGTKTLLTGEFDTPLAGWRKALEWVANMDPESVEKQRKRAIKRQSRQHFKRKARNSQVDNTVPDPESE